jgi:hypothetical protein
MSATGTGYSTEALGRAFRTSSIIPTFRTAWFLFWRPADFACRRHQESLNDQHRQVALQLEKEASLPASNIIPRIHTKDETLHMEIIRNFDDDESFYEEHEPLEGFKLLDHAVRGGLCDLCCLLNIF